MEITQVISRMETLLNIIPPLVRMMDDGMLHKPGHPGKWSPLQIIGHLIDSAANNHQRVIRSQYQHSPDISYDQVAWNRLGHYDKMDRENLLQLWVSYNRHLVHLFRQLSPTDRTRTYRVNDTVYDLDHLATDYLAHLEHHLHQFLTY
jgi:hypothetical protein